MGRESKGGNGRVWRGRGGRGSGGGGGGRFIRGRGNYRGAAGRESREYAPITYKNYYYLL